MMTFRKLSADSSGATLRKYFTEDTPEPSPDAAKQRGPRAEPGARLTAYYTGRDTRSAPAGVRRRSKAAGRIVARRSGGS